MTDKLTEVRWAVNFETTDGKTAWFDQEAKHPAGAKKAAIEELERMGYEVDKFQYVTRTEATKSRAVMLMHWGDRDSWLERTVDRTIGALFDQECKSDV